jgi:hypothetical protein
MYFGQGLQITAKPSKEKLSKRHDKISTRVQSVALLGSWRPLGFLVGTLENRMPCGKAELPANFFAI